MKAPTGSGKTVIMELGNSPEMLEIFKDWSCVAILRLVLQSNGDKNIKIVYMAPTKVITLLSMESSELIIVGPLLGAL